MPGTPETTSVAAWERDLLIEEANPRTRDEDALDVALRDGLQRIVTHFCQPAGWEAAALRAAAREARRWSHPDWLADVLYRAALSPEAYVACGERYDRTESGCCHAARRAIGQVAADRGMVRCAA